MTCGHMSVQQMLTFDEVKSEVRILGAETKGGVILLSLDKETPNGSLIS